MNQRLELLEDRLDDLESHIIRLHQAQKKSRQLSRKKLSRLGGTIVIVPIILSLFILLGLNINYQSNDKSFSYNSNAIVEVILVVITTFSGGYVANKYHNEHPNE